MTKLKYEEWIITPERAKEILDNFKNENNRCINRANVLTFARMMREGKWTLDGEPIVFDWNGICHDGHHRLHAVIEAGVPVEFSVLCNVNPDTFVCVNTGRARTAADVFKMKAVLNYTNVSSIVRRFYSLNRGVNATKGDGNGSFFNGYCKPTNDEMLNIYEQHPDIFQEFSAYAQCLRNHRCYYQISELGGFMSFLHLTLGYQKELIYNFFNCIFQYKTEEEYSLCREVREIITKAALKGYKLPGVYKQSILAEAWNAYSKGDKKRKKLAVSMNTKLISFE